ncbi:MAG TPA: ABC transporter permease [Bacteroidota bacterium]|nr:ABC transporter permease [Bacteroidota bacterium]
MQTILHIVRKEFLQLRQDRKMFGMSFIAPVIQLLLLGYAANLDVSEIPMLVMDLDRSEASRGFVARFTSTGYFRIVDYVEKDYEIDHLMEDGHASVALVIPSGFERKLGQGRPAPVQVIADGSETTSGGVGLSYASQIAGRFSQDILIERIFRRGGAPLPPRLNAEIRVWYNPELKSRNFMVPGVLGLLLMVMTMLLTSLAIVKEKELGTLEQLIVTPISPRQLIIGKIVPFLMIGIVDVFLVVGVATFFFDLPVKGGFWLLFSLCLIFLLTTLGLGLFVSTVSRTQQQAMMTAIFFVMMPMMFFSGFVFPIENMPTVIQYISLAMPLRYFFAIVRGIFLKGVGLETLWPQAVALLVFGITIFTASVLRFRKRLS